MNAVLVGSTVDNTKFNDDGTAEVTVSLPGMQLWGVFHDQMRMAGGPGPVMAPAGAPPPPPPPPPAAAVPPPPPEPKETELR